MPRTASANRLRRAEARENILEAATAVFGEKGFDGATTAEVAAAAGVSKGLVFNYFPTKQALLEALLERTTEAALAYWEAQKWEGPAAAQLAMLVDGALDQVIARPGFYRLYLSLGLLPGGTAAIAAATARLKPRLDAYYARGARLMAELGSDDPLADARILQLAIAGASHVLAAQPGLAAEDGGRTVAALKRRLLARFLPIPPKG